MLSEQETSTRGDYNSTQVEDEHKNIDEHETHTSCAQAEDCLGQKENQGTNLEANLRVMLELNKQKDKEWQRV